MKTIINKGSGLLLGLVVASTVVLPQQSFAQDDEMIEEIVTTGTRRADRSAADSPVPIDVISGTEFTQAASADVQDLLRTAVPSFDVNTQPISDAATISRPANVRGLSPDNVLILVNGKRRHRGSVISFLGGGISDGAQGVDISSIPALALKQVEVLRDGASSQYGSDAIAGVINFVLRDANEGGDLQVNYGSTYDGDGDNYRVAGNIGLPLGKSGFINLTGEINDVEGTVRSVVRDDVLALIAAGNTDVADFQTVNSYTSTVPQYWGQPDVTDDMKFFVNAGVDLSENAELYFFGNYAQRTAEGGFFFRNPTNRGGVYAGPLVDANGDLDSSGFASVRVGNLGAGTCPAGIPLTGTDGLIMDPTVLAAVTADPDCFSFVETIPSGFVPRFGGDNEDMAIAAGLRGEFNLGSGLSYDFSVSQGSNRTDFFIRNTVNASLGPNTPRDFVPGGQEQTETMVNADFVYAMDVGFASDLNVAFGTEYRKEEFDLFAGDPASYALGPLADQGFSSSSNGFGGFPNNTSADQDSIAAYVDLEADLTDRLTLQAAVRFEDFSEFGDTTDVKLAGMFHVSDTFRIRGAVSTGFHAPTAGQANITNVTTQNVGGVLQDQGTLPLSSPAGQLAADYIEGRPGGTGRPALGPEEALNMALGFSVDIGESTWTVDFYNIELEDRVALGANVNFLNALNYTAGFTDAQCEIQPSPAGCYDTVSEALTGLDADGTIERTDFIGLDDLTVFRFFANSFDTTTTGIDVVGNFGFALGSGESTVTVAANYNKTEVDNVGTVNPIDDDRVRALEDLLPNIKGSVTWTHLMDNIRTMVRANYYGGWDDTGNGVDGIGAVVLFDAELAYQINDKIEVVGGLANLFDTYPDKNPWAGDLGQLYSEASPFGFNGGQWYVRARMTF